MTMSCDAEPNAIRIAIAAITTTSAEAAPARASVTRKRKSWHTRIQERRRPIRPKRGPKRSIKGDQRNLKVQGACASEKRPTVLMSTPR
jgi:hypothetical protein